MMIAVPLDPSLDVSRRLADLRRWQADWRHIDRQLEEQLLQLDGNNLLQLQQAVHISNLRRRMAMMLVRQLLSIPEGVLKDLGVEAVRSQFAQQFARLTREERLLWLNSFLFFMTADLRKLDDKIAHVRAYRSLGQTRNFLLGENQEWARRPIWTGSFFTTCRPLSESAIVFRSLVWKLQ